MSKLQKCFGYNLKFLRKTAGITQEELAERVALDPKQISKIETGKHFPSVKTLESLCIALECRLEALFNFDFGHESVDSDLPLFQRRLMLLYNISKKHVRDENRYKMILLMYKCFNDKEALEELYYIIQGMMLKN